MHNIYNRIPIVYFHSVAPSKDSGWYKTFLTRELKYFEDLLKYLKSKKYEFLSLDEYFIRRTDPAAKNKKMISFQFDDGFLDNYVYVFPLLKKYKAKGTIFVNPVCIQDQPDVRPTIEHVWSGRLKQDELQSLGYLSWKEMKIMEDTEIMDIQSHTMTHTKYYSSDEIREFHNSKANFLYPIGNLYPEQRPYYIINPDFKNLLPYGTPFFAETSSVICRRVHINNDFENECVEILRNCNWQNYKFDDCFQKVKNVYEYFKSKDNLISHMESQDDYETRVHYEIKESKKILESRLDKTVNHICWPHGDYNDYCHEIAKRAGYQSSSVSLNFTEANTWPDRFHRTASGISKNSRFLTLWKARYKIGAYRAAFPYHLIASIYLWGRYGE